MIEMLEHKAFWLPVVLFAWTIISWYDWDNTQPSNNAQNVCHAITWISTMISIAAVSHTEIGEWWWKIPSFIIGIATAIIGVNYLSSKAKRGLSYLGLIGFPILIALIINMNMIAKAMKYY